MTALNQEAPPAEVAKDKAPRLQPFPRSDSYVLTVVGTNYIPEYEFERKDEATGEEYTKVAPAFELYLGTMVDGKPYFVKTWPQLYKVGEKTNFTKWYEAFTGIGIKDQNLTPPKLGSLLGRHCLSEVKIEEKAKRKGGTYTATNVKTIGKVPSILVSTATKLDDLKAAFDTALAAKDGDVPF